ncbi:anti-repressor Ant [Melanoplus sanguinipes entomopoxvirus]|uniref:ORF MSV023 ALI motif gene family protein n=1 Tax=Melanoplus sanguinipes entomopoxvirus TaxID=83191 RepID=Q9YW69_MSEPV|nr:anti-repressor Ant [Melanoplus sanguinipes entomopoxvirus]AAC97848.1 ORF MSV023 ALI motif gene family protein [Melanoplus sanguinipes entomopoxvirus 'O']
MDLISKINIITYNNCSYYKAKDIADILNYKSVDYFIKKYVKNEHKINYESTIYVNNSGLYYIMFKSKKHEAEKFQNWIKEENLPEIENNKIEKITTKFQNLLYLKEQIQKQLNQEKEQLKKEKEQLCKQLNKEKEQLEQEKQLKEQYKEYCNRLQKLEKNEIIYVLTNNTDLSNNIFKIGKTNINSIKNRLSTYNTGASDPYYYVFYKNVYDGNKIEKEFNYLMNRYNVLLNNNKINVELYKLYFPDLEYVLNAVIDSNDVLINIIKQKHEEFYINSINKKSIVNPIIFENNRPNNIFDNLSSNEKKKLIKEAFIKYNKSLIKRKDFEKYFKETFNYKINKKINFWNEMKNNCPIGYKLYYSNKL